MQNCVFLCSLDNFPLKHVIVSFLEIKFKNGAHLKKGYFDLLFTFSSNQGKDTKKPAAHISHKRILLTLALLTFLP